MKTAESVRVKRNLKHAKGLVARSFEGKGGKSGGRLIRNLYQRVKFVHTRVVYINEN
jgi:hypothetical protein